MKVRGKYLRTNDPISQQSSGWNFRLLSIYPLSAVYTEPADQPAVQPSTAPSLQSRKSRNSPSSLRNSATYHKRRVQNQGCVREGRTILPHNTRGQLGLPVCGGVKAIKEVCPETVVYAAEVGYNQATVHKTTRQRYYCHLNGLSLRLDESSLAPSKRGNTRDLEIKWLGLFRRY